ncbi:ABC transporter [Nocardiopsis sp. NPDC006938]|uniref:ABC transporter n=1 Tax=Nocardiopsis sp. NPDC006938 TaxID=3364337 RepID=UPI0036737676
MTRRHRTAALGAATLITLLAGCSGGGTAAEPEPEEETPHGYVEGAEEAAEPQLRLVVADTDTGRVRLLDLITEEVTELGEVPGVDGVMGDGRFAYLSSSDEGTTEVFDSGVWTVDHGDHNHYYRTASGDVGALDLSDPAHVVTDTALTSVTTGRGASLLLERAELEDGTVATAGVRVDEGTTVLPYQGALVAVDADGTVRALDRDGEPQADPGATCTDPDGAALTRRGLVVGCSEGTLHVTEEDGDLTASTLPHPGEGRGGPFLHRSGSAVLAALPDDDTLWVLDLAVPEWRAHDQPGTVAATTTGEEGPVLALADDGTLRALDPRTGEEEAATALLDTVDPEHPPTLAADTSRAYVSDPGAGVVHEIDYADDLRVARTLEPGIAPHLMIQTGR